MSINHSDNVHPASGLAKLSLQNSGGRLKVVGQSSNALQRDATAAEHKLSSAFTHRVPPIPMVVYHLFGIKPFVEERIGRTPIAQRRT
jgi:hypothetical protein